MNLKGTEGLGFDGISLAQNRNLYKAPVNMDKDILGTIICGQFLD